MTERQIKSICADLLVTIDVGESFSEVLSLYLYNYFVYEKGLGSEDAEKATADIFEKYETTIKDYEDMFYKSIA